MSPRIKWIAAASALVALLALGGWLVLSFTAQRSVRRQIEEAAARSPVVEEVRLGKLDVGALRRRGEARDVRLRLKGGAGEVVVERLAVRELELGKPVPSRMRIEASGIRLEGGEGPWQRMLGDLGYPRAIIDLAIAYRLEGESHNLSIEQLDLTLRQGGTLSLSGRIGNVDAARIAQAAREPSQLLFLLPGLTVERFELRYADASFASRLQKSIAAREGSTPERLRQETADRLAHMAERQKSDRTREALNALRSFVLAPEGLTVTATPKKPVALFQFFLTGGLEDVIRLLDLHVSR